MDQFGTADMLDEDGTETLSHATPEKVWGVSSGTITSITNQLTSVLLSVTAFRRGGRMLRVCSPLAAVGRAVVYLFLAIALESVVDATAPAAAATAGGCSGTVFTMHRRAVQLLRQYTTVLLSVLLSGVADALESEGMPPPTTLGDWSYVHWISELPWQIVVILTVAPVVLGTARG